MSAVEKKPPMTFEAFCADRVTLTRDEALSKPTGNLEAFVSLLKDMKPKTQCHLHYGLVLIEGDDGWFVTLVHDDLLQARDPESLLKALYDFYLDNLY